MATVDELMKVATNTLANPGQNMSNENRATLGLAPINSSSLQPTKQINYNTPQETPVPNISTLNSEAYGMTDPQKQAQTQVQKLQDLNNALLGEGSYRTEQENLAGLSELKKTQTDLAAQLKAIQNEQQMIPLQMQQEALGRGITTGGLQPLQTGRLRENAIRALSVNSLLEASRGNLTTATELVDRAVKAKFDPIREEIKTKIANLELFMKSPEYTNAEKKQAAAQLRLQQAEERKILKDEEDYKSILDISKTAAKSGASSELLNKISNAKTPIEAINLAGNYLDETLSQILTPTELETLKSLGINLPYGTTKRDAINQAKAKGIDIADAGIVGTYTADQIANAIKNIESGGNYDAKGASGEFGAYQFMPETWKQYSEEYRKSKGLRMSLAPTKENQDAVVKFKIQQWLDAGKSADQIALMWNAGEGATKPKSGVNAMGVPYSTSTYVGKIKEELGKISADAGVVDIDKVKRNLLATNLTKSQRTDLVNLIDTDGVEGLKTWSYSNKLNATERADYDLYDNARAAFQRALFEVDNNDATAGPYKTLWQNAKPYLLMQKDPQYVSLFSIIEQGQAQLRKGYYGTAVTDSEAVNAKRFLIDPQKDDMNTIRLKLIGGQGFLNFVNEAKIARSLGLPKPDIFKYLPTGTTPTNIGGSTQTYSSGQSGSLSSGMKFTIE